MFLLMINKIVEKKCEKRELKIVILVLSTHMAIYMFLSYQEPDRSCLIGGNNIFH